MNFNYQEKKKESLKIGMVFETEFYKYLIIEGIDGKINVVNLSLNNLCLETFNDINEIKKDFSIIKVFYPEDVKVTLLTNKN